MKDAPSWFSRVYEIIDGKKTIISEIPASSTKLDEQLGTYIFPKKREELWFSKTEICPRFPVSIQNSLLVPIYDPWLFQKHRLLGHRKTYYFHEDDDL